MDNVYAIEMETEWCGVSFRHEFLSALRARNLAVEVEQLYTVGTIRHGSDENSTYVMAEVTHLKAPMNEVDVVNAERKTTYICGCPGFYNHAYDNQIGVKVDDCKHTSRAKQKARTEMPDEQTTLEA